MLFNLRRSLERPAAACFPPVLFVQPVETQIATAADPATDATSDDGNGEQDDDQTDFVVLGTRSARDATLGGVAHVGDRAGAIDTSGWHLPAHTKAKLAGELGIPPFLTLRAEADNLFDAQYAMSSYSPLGVFPGAPRTVRLSARMGF